VIAVVGDGLDVVLLAEQVGGDRRPLDPRQDQVDI